MEKKHLLSAEKRDLRNTNQAGKVQAVFYGFQTKPMALFVNASDILRIYRQTGMSTIFDLEIEGKKTQVLIKELILHPVKHEIQHLDFFAVNPKKKTKVKIPFKFTGVAPAVKNFGGIFAVSHDSIEIKCLPKDIPEFFEIDISSLSEIGANIKVLEAVDSKYEIIKIAPNVSICSIMGRKALKKDESEEVGDNEEKTTEKTTEK